MVKILVAEDDTFLSSLIVNDFHNAGYDVMGAFDGNEAMEKIKSWHPDFIVLDIMMPIKDGYGVLEDLKNDSACSQIPVMVLSNLGEAGDIERVKKFGVVDYMVKANTTPKSVVEKVRSLLAQV